MALAGTLPMCLKRHNGRQKNGKEQQLVVDRIVEVLQQQFPNKQVVLSQPTPNKQGIWCT